MARACVEGPCFIVGLLCVCCLLFGVCLSCGSLDFLGVPFRFRSPLTLYSAGLPSRCQSWISGLPRLFVPGRLSCWLLFLALWRLGEAATPGPEFTIGVANFNGLHNKAFGLAESTVHTWLVSETHLTRGGIHTFQANLRQAKAPYRSLIHGCPVAARADTSEIGQWSGVGALSVFPSRRLPHAWPPAAYNSGRLVCSGFCAHNVWVSGVTVYGTPTGGTHVNGKEVTNELLSLALDRVLQMPGPRFIAGDFNHDLTSLPIVSTMERLGFRDIQDLRAERTGQHPEATCRGKTRRDYLFVSRELALLFLRCHVDDDSVSDHSYLIGTFSGDQELLTRFVWPIPDPMDWEPVAQRATLTSGLFRGRACSLSDDYEQFWTEVESANLAASACRGKQLPRSMVGRGRQRRPQTRFGQLAPVKTSRPGDRQPAFLGSCVQHSQWLKQLRRLQSFVRLARVNVDSASHRAHRFGLWTSVLGASGFSPSFSVWWTTRSLAVGDPLHVPIEPPPADLALRFYAGFELEFIRLEATLRSARSHANRLAKASDVQAMYRSVQRDIPVQVDSLVGTVSTTVTSIDEDECALIIAEPANWNPDAPVMHSSGPLGLIHAEADKVWVDSCSGVAIGDVLSQTSFTTSLPALFEAFESFWRHLWNQHAAVPPSQWDAIIQFASTQLSPLPSSQPAFTVQSVRRCLTRKSARSATGLDGVSRVDLLALADSDLTLLLRTFHLAGLHGEWPSQVLNGYVRSLAKVPDPESVGQYRPITVFSIWYRTWSSISARHWLAQLSQVVDPLLCGNAVGCRAGMVWRHVLEQVEAAHRQELDVCGFSADIVKAFNALPRKPVFAAAKMLGIDQATLVAWAGALQGFRRHFVVRGSYSDGVDSQNGFPEGCAMSCVAMMILTQLFHRWMLACNSMFRPVSYVDNWAVLLHQVDYMRQATDAVDHFASLLKIQLDTKKSFTWCTSVEGRKKLRAQGFAVLLSTRELGAHVVYSRQLANKTALDRFRCLSDFWSKLACSTCGFRQKITLIQRVAWPRAMHAISSVVVGKRHFEALRTSAMQALQLQKPGANPFLELGLEGLCCDPLVYGACETFRDARALGVDFCVIHDLDAGPLGGDVPQFNTLSEILCQRLHQVGFQVHPHGLVGDRIGHFRFLECSFGELLYRIQLAWTVVLSGLVGHRTTFRGFEHVDMVHTRKAYLALEPYDQGILRKHLHGANLTNEHAQHWADHGQATCFKCGALDSTRHRLWECPATAFLRALLPEDFLCAVPSLPTVVIEHGWTLRAGLMDAWLQYLDSTPAVIEFLPVRHVPSILDLFTDGSCLAPTDPDLRCAAWSVVLAGPFRLDFDGRDFLPVAAQPLPGLVQSAYRAELYALTVALRFALRFGCGIRVWTDCQSVIDAFCAHVRDQHPVRANSKHCDLLKTMQDLCSELGLGLVEVLKVPAHVSSEQFSNDLERWLIFGNDFADKVAKQANRARPASVWRLHAALAEQLSFCRYLADQARTHLVAVGKFWSTSGSSRDVMPPEHRPVRVGRQMPTLVWNMPAELVLVGRVFSRTFGSQLASWLATWISDIRDPAQPLRWVSFLHLFVSFQKRFGPVHVYKSGGEWHLETGEIARLGNHVRIGLRVKWFRLMFQQYLRDCRVQFCTATVRPFSQWISCFRGSIGFELSQSEFDLVEGYLASQLREPATGSGKTLDLLRGL